MNTDDISVYIAHVTKTSECAEMVSRSVCHSAAKRAILGLFID